MLNRLPDRGSDTKRSVGSFQDMQSALGRAAGWESMDVRGEKLALNVGNINEETGEIPHFMPGRGHVEESRPKSFDKAREGDMYN